MASVSSHPSVICVIFTVAAGRSSGHCDSTSNRKPCRASMRALHPAHGGGDGDEQNASTDAPCRPGIPLPYTGGR